MVLFHLNFFSSILYLFATFFFLTLHQLILFLLTLSTILHYHLSPFIATVHLHPPSTVVGRCRLPSLIANNCHWWLHRQLLSITVRRHCLPCLPLFISVSHYHLPLFIAANRYCSSSPAAFLSLLATTCHP